MKMIEDTKLSDLVKEFLSILDIVEESDSGREFRPTTIQSCRCMDLSRIGEILKDMRKITEDNGR